LLPLFLWSNTLCTIPIKRSYFSLLSLILVSSLVTIYSVSTSPFMLTLFAERLPLQQVLISNGYSHPTFLSRPPHNHPLPPPLHLHPSLPIPRPRSQNLQQLNAPSQKEMGLACCLLRAMPCQQHYGNLPPHLLLPRKGSHYMER